LLAECLLALRTAMCYRAWNYEAPFPRPRRGSNLAPFACPGCKAGGTIPCEHTFDMGKCKYDWAAVLRYHREGHTLAECRAKFGYATDAWYKAIARGAIAAPPPQNSGGTRRYDWREVQRYYDEGNSYRECRIRFGFAAESWHKAVKRGAIRTREARWPIERVIREAKNRTHLKTRLLEAGLLQNRCQECGLSEWRGKRLSIQIDHINGIKNDNRLENLRMLCPNCHSQTETFASRNRRKLRIIPG